MGKKQPKLENWYFEHIHTSYYKGIDVSRVYVHVSTDSILLVTSGRAKSMEFEYTKEELIEYGETRNSDGKRFIKDAYHFLRRLTK